MKQPRPRIDPALAESALAGRAPTIVRLPYRSETFAGWGVRL